MCASPCLLFSWFRLSPQIEMSNWSAQLNEEPFLLWRVSGSWSAAKPPRCQCWRQSSGNVEQLLASCRHAYSVHHLHLTGTCKEEFLIEFIVWVETSFSETWSWIKSYSWPLWTLSCTLVGHCLGFGKEFILKATVMLLDKLGLIKIRT